MARLGRAAVRRPARGRRVAGDQAHPGHGRATVDSHHACPRRRRRARRARRAPISRRSAPLADMPWAMTAHVVYRAIDPRPPATLSPRGHRPRSSAARSASTACWCRTTCRWARWPAASATRAEAALRGRLRHRAPLQRRDGRDGARWPKPRRPLAASRAAPPRARRGDAPAARVPFDRAAAEARFAALIGAAAPDRDGHYAVACCSDAIGCGAAGDLRDHACTRRRTASSPIARRRYRACAPGASPSIRCKHIDPVRHDPAAGCCCSSLARPFPVRLRQAGAGQFRAAQPSAPRHGAGGDRRAGASTSCWRSLAALLFYVLPFAAGRVAQLWAARQSCATRVDVQRRCWRSST